MARDLVGKVVGGYRLGEVLGKGKAATVYEAEQQATGRKVAVKVFQADFSREKNAAVKLVAEVQKTTSIKHRNLVEVLDVGTVEHKGKRHLYIAMERLSGQTLSHRLSERPGRALPLPEALQIASDVGAALQAIHRAGSKHRSVTASAVFLQDAKGEDGEPLVKLLDLGAVLIIAADPSGPSAPQAEEDDLKALGLLTQEMLGGIQRDGGQPVLPLRLRNREVPVHVDAAVRRALGQIGGAGFKSLAALVAALFAPFYYGLLFGADPQLGAVIVMSILLVLRHSQNIANLVAGKESRIGSKSKDAQKK